MTQVTGQKKKTTGCITHCVGLRQFTRKRWATTMILRTGIPWCIVLITFYPNLFLKINCSTRFMPSLYDLPAGTYIMRRCCLSACLSVCPRLCYSKILKKYWIKLTYGSIINCRKDFNISCMSLSCSFCIIRKAHCPF